MSKQILNNPHVPPTPELLQKVMGDNYANFISILNVFHKYGICYQWNYYNDGKSWLCKVYFNKKTILWLSVWDDCFKISFFFTEKTKNGIYNLEIDASIKDEFRQQKVIGKLIPLVFRIKDNSMLLYVEKVVEYKMKCR